MSNKLSFTSEEDIKSFLDWLYDGCIAGIPKVSRPISQMAADYLKKHSDTNEAIKAMIKNQVLKCTTTGVVTGLGGLVTLPAAVTADVGSVLYVQMRMIACTAYMAGFDLASDQVQAIVYACLAGVAVNEIIKKVGIEFGEKVAINLVKKIPGSALVKINQKVGFRLITKFGEKGVINLGKMVPGVGAAISGGFDYVETKLIGDRAYKWFVNNDFTIDNDPNTDDYAISAEDIKELYDSQKRQ